MNWAKTGIEAAKIILIIIGFYFIRTMFNNDDKILEIEKAQQGIIMRSDSIIALQNQLSDQYAAIDTVLIHKIDSINGSLSNLRKDNAKLDRKINSFQKEVRENKVNLPNPWEN